MTLGQKLAGYRRLAGMTQQQLGDYLNISPQAISKWEKDLSEPALATVRALADLYKVSVDEILDLKSGFPDISALSAAEETENESPAVAATIGFCKECGIAVTDNNVGTTKPVVMCKSCLDEKKKREQLAAESERRKSEEKVAFQKAKVRANRNKIRRHFILSFIFASLAALPVLIFMISEMVSDFSIGLIPLTLILTYSVFSFVACLFYDCFIPEIVLDWFDKSIHFPGLIFTFDLDGIIWLIGMKLLFWVIGLLFGIVTALIGIFIGMVCGPFVFPFVMVKERRAYKKGLSV